MTSGSWPGACPPSNSAWRLCSGDAEQAEQRHLSGLDRLEEVAASGDHERGDANARRKVDQIDLRRQRSGGHPGAEQHAGFDARLEGRENDAVEAPLGCRRRSRSDRGRDPAWSR